MMNHIFGMLLLLAAPYSAKAEHGLLFVTVDNFPPYTWFHDGKPTGIDIDIINTLAERSGLPIGVELLPPKRVVRAVEIGSADGMFAAFKTPARDVFAYTIEAPLHFSTYQIFVKKGNEFPFKTIQDLDGKTIGKHRGFHISTEYSEAVANKRFQSVEVDAMEQNIRMLNKGRTDAFIGNDHEVAYTLKQLGILDEIVSLSVPVKTPQAAYLMISKASHIEDKEEVMQILFHTLRIMKADGTIQAIYAKYGNE